MNKIILISGTPASGKDSVSNYLVDVSDKFTHFKKHKINSGGKLDDSYILVDKSEFDEMAENEKFAQYHYRYERGYGVSKAELQKNFDKGLIPIIHVGKYENIFPFYDLENVEIFSILLLTSAHETNSRLMERHANNNEEIEARMKAYNEERDELSKLIKEGEKLKFDFIIENTNLEIAKTAKLIEKLI